MILLLKKGIREGISQCCRRYTQANKYTKRYDRNLESNYLVCLELNNFYGWAISQQLPSGGLRLFGNQLDVDTIPNDTSKEYILEVYLEHPRELHDKHSDSLLAP